MFYKHVRLTSDQVNTVKNLIASRAIRSVQYTLIYDSLMVEVPSVDILQDEVYKLKDRVQSLIIKNYLLERRCKDELL